MLIKQIKTISNKLNEIKKMSQDVKEQHRVKPCKLKNKVTELRERIEI